MKKGDLNSEDTKSLSDLVKALKELILKLDKSQNEESKKIKEEIINIQKKIGEIV